MLDNKKQKKEKERIKGEKKVEIEIKRRKIKAKKMKKKKQERQNFGRGKKSQKLLNEIKKMMKKRKIGFKKFIFQEFSFFPSLFFVSFGTIDNDGAKKKKKKREIVVSVKLDLMYQKNTNVSVVFRGSSVRLNIRSLRRKLVFQPTPKTSG